MASRDAIVVLGCRLPRGGSQGALARRVARAALAYRDGLAEVVVASGGQYWAGESEAAWIQDRLVTLAVPRLSVLLEERSLNTYENARYSADLLRQMNAKRVLVVTCDFHIPRALRAFRRFGIDAIGLATPSPPSRLGRRLFRTAKESLSHVVQSRLDSARETQVRRRG